MNVSTGKTRLRQAVGSFDDAAGLHAIVQVLVDQGVAFSDLTVLAGQWFLDGELVPYQRNNPETILDSVLASMNEICMTAGTGPLLASSTPFGDVLVAAAADMAETEEPFLTLWLSPRHASYLQQQLDAGGALLCVHVRNGEEEKLAGRALLQHSRHQVQVHDFSFSELPTSPPAA